MPLKIYYIDDELALCENFTDFFSSKDVEVITFTDPVLAIAASKDNPPDILFVDYRLPNSTGDQVAKTININIPKYLVTGDINVKTQFKFDAIFSKPYKPEEIQAVIDRFAKVKLVS
jgi:DNA-binding response OmpR family regulator